MGNGSTSPFFFLYFPSVSFRTFTRRCLGRVAAKQLKEPHLSGGLWRYRACRSGAYPQMEPGALAPAGNPLETLPTTLSAEHRWLSVRSSLRFVQPFDPVGPKPGGAAPLFLLFCFPPFLRHERVRRVSTFHKDWR